MPRDRSDDDRPLKRRPSRIDDDDDNRPRKRRPVRDDEDDDDRPVRKGGKSMLVPLILIAALGLMVVVGGGIGLLYWLTMDTAKKGGQTDTNQTNTPGPAVNNPGNNIAAQPKNNPPPGVKLPVGWEKFNDPLSELALYFPAGQPEKNEKASDEIARASGGAADSWTKIEGGKVYSLSRMTVSDADMKKKKPEVILFEAQQGMGKGLGAAGQGKYDPPVFSNGQVSRVVVFDVPSIGKRFIVRGYVSGNRVFLAFVTGEPNITAKDADIQPFLDNMRPLK
jgi:hypothetical protein